MMSDTEDAYERTGSETENVIYDDQVTLEAAVSANTISSGLIAVSAMTS